MKIKNKLWGRRKLKNTEKNNNAHKRLIND